MHMNASKHVRGRVEPLATRRRAALHAHARTTQHERTCTRAHASTSERTKCANLHTYSCLKPLAKALAAVKRQPCQLPAIPKSSVVRMHRRYGLRSNQVLRRGRPEKLRRAAPMTVEVSGQSSGVAGIRACLHCRRTTLQASRCHTAGRLHRRITCRARKKCASGSSRS